jgi:hypothetical protein
LDGTAKICKLRIVDCPEFLGEMFQIFGYHPVQRFSEEFSEVAFHSFALSVP